MVVTLLVCIVPISASASETDVIYFDDGSYITVQMSMINLRASGTVKGNKVYTHYGSDNASNWKVVLTGSFTHTGSNATCTASSIDVTIYDSAWYVISKSANKSGNEAYGTATIGEKVLGVTVSKISTDLSLSCDANGNLS